MKLQTACRLLVGLFCIASFSAAAQSVTFRYNPPTRLTWIRTLKYSASEVTKETIDTPSLSEHKMVSRVTLQRNDAGYSLTEVLRQTEEKIDGQLFENPTKPLLLGRTNVTYFSREGEILDISGHDDLIESLKKILPQKTHPALERNLEKGAALQAERLKWEISTKRFVNKQVSVGDVWLETIRSGNEPSSETQYVLTRISKIATINGRTLVTVVYATSAQPGEVDDLDLTQPPSKLRETFLWSRSFPSRLPTLRVIGSAVLDAETLLVRKDEKLSYELARGPKGGVVRNESRIETLDPEQ